MKSEKHRNRMMLRDCAHHHEIVNLHFGQAEFEKIKILVRIRDLKKEQKRVQNLCIMAG